MLEPHFHGVLAIGRTGQILMPLAFGALFAFGMIRALWTGKAHYRGASYSREGDGLMFWFCVFVLGLGTFLMFVLILSAVFEP